MAEAGSPGLGESGRAARRRHVTSVQLVLAFALAIGLVLILNFSSRIQLDRDLGRIHLQFSGEIKSLLADQEALAQELAYVKSDSYVEYWARDEGKMIRDGEVLILPQGVGPEPTIPASTVHLFEFETTAPEPQNWELWWALFFDGPPPRLD